MDKKRLVKLISAFSMADGGLYKKSKTGNAYFCMNMLTCHMDYIDWVADTLSNVTGVTKSKIKNPCKRPQTTVYGRAHPLMTQIHGRVYRDCGYKGLDEHVMRMFDWEIMAIFYMADGCLYVEPPKEKKGLVNPSPNVTLNMKRLSYGDSWFLKKTIKDVLGVEFNVLKHNYKGKTYYYMRLRRKDVEKYMEGVAPYIVPSFRHKLYDSERKAPVAERPGDEIV